MIYRPLNEASFLSSQVLNRSMDPRATIETTPDTQLGPLIPQIPQSAIAGLPGMHGLPGMPTLAGMQVPGVNIAY